MDPLRTLWPSRSALVLALSLTPLIIPLVSQSPLLVSLGGGGESGPGLLTRSLLDANPLGVIVVEKDRRFLPVLEVCPPIPHSPVQQTRHVVCVFPFPVPGTDAIRSLWWQAEDHSRGRAEA